MALPTRFCSSCTSLISCACNGRQTIPRDQRLALIDAGLQVEERLAQRFRHNHRAGRAIAEGAHLGVGQQVLQQNLHAVRAVDDVGNILFALARQAGRSISFCSIWL